MLDVRHSSSKPRVTLALAMMATAFLGGCSQTTGSALALKNMPAPKAEKVDAIKVAAVPKADNVTLAGVRTSPYHLDENSSWCRYLKSNAAAEGEIIASPTLSASSDEEGNGALNIGMNLLDLKKAELIRQSADNKCRAHAAGKSIEVTMRLASESTKFASDYAKYQYLANNMKKATAIVSRGQALTSAGSLTVQQSNALRVERDALKAKMSLAKSDADKRKDIPAIDRNTVSGSNAALLDATQRLQSIDREIRTIDAFDVSVQAGYRFNEGDVTTGGDDDYYAKIKVGVRLGVLSQRRRNFEEDAENARLAALNEENSGPIWQSGFAAQSINKSMSGLRSAEKSLLQAIAAAKDTARRLTISERPELLYAALQSKLTIISLSADLAGVRASIRELKQNAGKLNALAN